MSFISRRRFRRGTHLNGSFLNAKPGEYLDDDALRRVVPSIYAEEPHESRSSRYVYIPTASILDGLRKEGFMPVAASQQVARSADRHGHAKHMIRLRHRSAEEAPARRVGQVYSEVVLINSHDGSSAYQMRAGMTRLVCLNGLTVSDQDFEPISVPHSRNAKDLVIEGSYRVLSESHRAIERAEEWTVIGLSDQQRIQLAKAARIIRLGDSDGKVTSPIQAEAFLRPRRYGDDRPDLWTTFNVIQENAIKGGLHAVGQDRNGYRRAITTKHVKAIDGDQKINRQLWHLAETFARRIGR